MKRPFLILTATIVSLLCMLPVTFAVTTSFWKQTTQAEFDPGKLKDVSTSSQGDITLAPAVEKLTKSQQPNYVWCLASDSDGNIYAGTGNDGSVYKIDTKNQVTELYKSSEPEVYSLAVDKENNVYVGTAPRGIIYKITPAGEVTIFHDSDQRYIWAMAFADNGILYAATGDNGILYAISADGKAEQVFDADDAHLVSMVVDDHGTIYAGTEPNGLVYKIAPSNKKGQKAAVSVLYDATEGEVRALALDGQGNLYAGTAAAQPPGGGPQFVPPAMIMQTSGEAGGHPPMATPSNNTSDEAQTGLPQTLSNILQMRAQAGAQQMGPQQQPANSVYKITPDGKVTQVLMLPQAFVFSLLTIEGSIYVGTGNEGKVYRLNGKDEVATLFDSDASQILALLRGDGEKLYLATGNNGSVQALSAEYAKKGTYESTVHDTTFIAHWGRIAWRAEIPKGTKITLSTRSGNSSSPDSTWSDWSKEYKDGNGEAITSSPARFVQYRIKLATSNTKVAPTLTEVTLAYLSRNRAPVITNLIVPDGQATQQSKNQQAGPKAQQGQQKAPSWQQTITWQASDPNGDALTFELFYRGEEEKEWKTLKEETSELTHVWDTRTVPDGLYRLRLSTTDASANPAGNALTHEHVSEVFIIDNTRPTVHTEKPKVSRKRTLTLKGFVEDDASYIAGIHYSLDAQEWKPVFPGDGILDEPKEEFSITIQELKPGEHTVIIKAVDARGNIGSGKATIRIKE